MSRETDRLSWALRVGDTQAIDDIIDRWTVAGGWDVPNTAPAAKPDPLFDVDGEHGPSLTVRRWEEESWSE